MIERILNLKIDEIEMNLVDCDFYICRMNNPIKSKMTRNYYNGKNLS